MEYVAIVVPLITVPLTLLAIYGATWPESIIDSSPQHELPKESLVAAAIKANGTLSIANQESVQT